MVEHKYLFTKPCLQQTKHTAIMEPLQIVTITLGSLLMVIIGVCMILWFILWNLKSVRRSQPLMMTFMGVGGLLMTLSCIFFALPVFVPMCYFRVWFFGLGFTLFFSALYSKTFRVFYIFNNPLRKVTFPDYYLVLFVFANVVFEIFITVLWQAISPYRVEHNQCDGNFYLGWFFIWCLNKFAMILFGLILTIATQRVSEYYNESKWLQLIVRFCDTDYFA